jgi:YD repeat-containing protein
MGFAIHYPVAKTRIFSADPTTPNHYIGAEGDYGSLTMSATDGSWTLTEPSGIVFHLAADPTTSGRFRLDYVKDLNGNQINLSYTGSQLTTVTDTKNDTLTYAWNSQGLISQMTDPVGRTTAYAYDTANHLLTITGAKGTTSLSWITGKGAAVENAISSIGFPNGTHAYYEYDSQGRISRIYHDGNANSSTIAWDASGGATVTTAGGASYSLAFNELGQLAQLTDPLGSTLQVGYNPEGNFASSLAPDGSASFIDYDGQGHPSAVRDQLGSQFSLAYSPAGAMQSHTDRLGNVTTFTLDVNQKRTAITYADGSSEQVTRDAQGRLISYTNRRGHQTAMSYDGKGQLTNKVYADGTQINFAYDSHRNLVSTTVNGSAATLARRGRTLVRMLSRPLANASTAVPNGTTSYTYDAADRVASIAYPSGGSLHYAYNANGQRGSMTDQAGNTVNYAYDAIGRISQMTNGAGALIVSYTYDPMGRIVRSDFGNRTYATMAYDTAGHLLHRVNYAASGAVSSRYDYAYDANGNRISMSTLNGVWTYQYDPKGQVVAENLPNGGSILFTYDAEGNRTAANYYGQSSQYNVNNLNQYTSAGGSSFSYDDDGDMTFKSDSSGATTYNYDDDGHMLSAANSSGTTTYEYDPLGNLAGQASAGVSSAYVNDLASLSGAAGLTSAAQVAGALDGAGNMTSYARGLDVAAAIGAGGAANYYQTDSAPGDPQANVAQVSGSNGSVLDSYSYDVNGIQSSSVASSQPFDFHSTVDMGNGTNAADGGVYSQQLNRAFQPGPGIDPNSEAYNPQFKNPIDYQDKGVSWDEQSSMLSLGGASPITDYTNHVEDLPTSFHEPGSFELHGANDISLGIDEVKSFKSTTGTRFIKGAGNVVGTGLGMLGLVADGYNVASDIHEQDYLGVWQDGTFTVIDVATTFVPELAPVQLTANVLNIGSKKGFYEFFKWYYHYDENLTPGWHCFHNRWWWLQHDLSSGDPNGKMTVGYGDQGFIPPGMSIDYTIYFENKPTATAPAAKVVVTDSLDANLDPSTVQLTQIAFNNVALNLPANAQSYLAQTAVSTNPDPVTVNAALDPISGTITWTIQSVDPQTGSLPTDPLAGFLPPNNSSHSGDGTLTFSVMPKAGLANGAVISNTARIVFDANAAINTNTVTNTIDSTYPTSTVNALPAVIGTPTFTVSWSGSDPSGAGVQSYDIWASVDSGPYALWLPATTLTSSAYSGAAGHTYSFYSLATSNTGRRQPAHGAAAATQVVTLQVSQTALTTTPSTANFGATITLTATVTGSWSQIASGSISFLDGANSIGTATLNASGAATLAIATLAAGQHSITAQYAGDNNYSASTSTAFNVVVNAADFTLASASNTMTVSRGSSATMALTVTPQNLYSQPIAFACANLPMGMTCSFAPVSVTPQSAVAATTMTVTASSTSAAVERRSLPWGGGGTVFAAALFFAFGRKRRYAFAWMLSFAVLAFGLLATGCGGGGHKPVTSTIQVTATSGAVQHSVNIEVTVN